MWTLYSDNRGSDELHIEADPATAERVVLAVIGEDAFESSCTCCGPDWNQREGDAPDGSFTTQPPLLEDLIGPHPDGSARTQVIPASEVARILGT